MDTEHFDNRPIGVFDSGYGGLTVARALQKRLPEESILYFGDSARCPYGPRDQAEVDGFVQQICTWLVGRDVKMIVIACNTATAAGLAHAQENFSVPVVGVVEPAPGGGPYDAQPARGGHRHQGHRGFQRLQRRHTPHRRRASPCSPRRRLGSWRSPRWG